MKPPEKRAQTLESTFRGQISEADYKKQAAAFDLEKRVAEAIHQRQVAQTDQETKAALEKLFSLIRDTKKTDVNRGNIEVLLLVFQELLPLREKLDYHAVNRLGNQLIALTEDMRSGDPEIRTQYLEQVFEDAIEAIGSLNPIDQDTGLSKRLKSAISEPNSEPSEKP